MKRIEAIIRPHKLKDVQEALRKEKMLRMTVTEVQGCGRQRGHTEIYRDSEYTVDLISKTKVEIYASDDTAQSIVQTILTAAKTGEVGDGKIFLSNINEIIRIRTSERGYEAL